jgi:transcriptional regulator with XRE-family HTH domain
MARRRIKHSEIVRIFAARLRQARLAAGMTQGELADKAHVQASYISDLEKAKVAPGIDLVDRLAKALDISVTDLLPPPPEETEDERRERVKGLFEEVVEEAGEDLLAALDVLLALLRELSSRRG